MVPDNLSLESEPISLGQSIIVIPNPPDTKGTQRVFIKVHKNENGPLTPGFYASSRNHPEVTEFLLNEVRPVTSSSRGFPGFGQSHQKTSIDIVHTAKPFPKVIHHPGRIEEILQEGKKIPHWFITLRKY